MLLKNSTGLALNPLTQKDQISFMKKHAYPLEKDRNYQITEGVDTIGGIMLLLRI